MSDMKFITNLKTRDPDLFTSKQSIQLKIHLRKLEEKLDPNRLYGQFEKEEHDRKLLVLMNNVSRVGGGLLKFIYAVDHYMDKYREIKPKKDRLATLQHEYETNLSELTRLESSIEKLTEILNESRKRFDTATEEKLKVQQQTDVAVRRRAAAETLLNGFQSETNRWKNDLNKMKIDQEELLGNCLISSAFLAYAGPFSYEIRQQLIEQIWRKSLIEKKIFISEHFRLEHFLSTKVEISEWNSQGLPSDEFSIQNGILTLKTNRFPFCIDPQLQGLLWIEEKEKKNNLKILSMRDREFVKHLELAMKYGSVSHFKAITFCFWWRIAYVVCVRENGCFFVNNKKIPISIDAETSKFQRQ